ncbi:MAG: ring-cleaving dioxygenase [Acidobacteriota bacterium]
MNNLNRPTSAPPAIRGLHHVTAIGSDPLTNFRFYTQTLGLRLVKKTVNFDDPGTYHLYYGDGQGQPGTILTFFPWPGARRGSRGAGQATATSFLVPAESLDFWQHRLEGQGVIVEGISTRFDDEKVLSFLDPDGLKLELIARSSEEDGTPWQTPEISPEQAIRGFDGVTLTVQNRKATGDILEAMGYRAEREQGARTRYVGDATVLGAIVDVLHTPQQGLGRVAAGSVHHVAFRVASDEEQLAWRERLIEAGMMITPVKDRQYFHSIYFREPGGVLFEIATDPPGFTFDESPKALGTSLRLPPWLEGQRQQLEATLPALNIETGEAAKIEAGGSR